MRRTRKLRAHPGPAKLRAAPAAEPSLADWNCARAFLEVARRGSFRAAAQALGTAVNTLRRKIDQCERQVGMKLFTRHIDGVRVTAEGAQLMAAAQRMEQAAFDIARLRNLDVSMQGEVRVSATEGLGTFWLSPRMVEFQQAHPGLLVDLQCAMRPADVLRLESDVGIQITRPMAKDLRIVKVGRMHCMPFASRAYLEAHGRPKSLADMGGHKIVLQVSEQINSLQELAVRFPGMPQASIVALRTNVSSAHYWMVARGGGIGILPTYAKMLGAGLEALDDKNLRFSYDILLAYHPDAAKMPRVRRMVDWLIASFSPRRYPCFADDFIHPRDLPDNAEGISLRALFEDSRSVREASGHRSRPSRERHEHSTRK